jgi:SAM-dependent methyltransferase
MNNIQGLVDQYYETYYNTVHQVQWKQTFYSPHRFIERKIRADAHFPIVLEVGGDEGQHLNFVKHKYDIYIVSDLRMRTNESLPLFDSGKLPLVNGNYFSIADATQLKYDSESIDRIVSGCLLLHLPDTLGAIEEWLRVLKVGGRIDAMVPCDEAFLVKCYRTLISRRKAKKIGFSHFDVVNAFEHVTYAKRVFVLVKHAFPGTKVEIDHFPPLLGRFRAFRAFSILRLTKLS